MKRVENRLKNDRYNVTGSIEELPFKKYLRGYFSMSLLANSHAKVTGQRSSIEQFLTLFQVEIVANPRNTISSMLQYL